MPVDVTETQKPIKGLSTKNRIILAVICLVLGALIFVFSYIGMRYGTGLGVFNKSILSWMVDHRNPNVTDTAKIITNMAGPLTLAFIVIVGAAAWAMTKREIWRPFLMAASVGVAALTSTILKMFFMDLRPPQSYMIPTFEIDFSFPSGHTIGIIVLLLVLGYLIYSRRFNAATFVTWIFVAVIGTGLIAISRLYLGYHWLTDVTASVGLGFIILAAAILVDLSVTKRFKKLK